MALWSADDIIGLIYDAPLAGSWTASLRALEQRLKCGYVVLMQHDTARGIQVPTGSDDQSIGGRYVEQYAPFNHAWPRLMQHTPGQPATDAMLLDMEAYRSSLFFNEFMRPNGLVSIAGCVLLRTPEMTAGITFSRPSSMSPFEEGCLDAIRPFVPHLTRAVQLQRRLGQAEHAANTAWETLERLRLGVVVVDAQARLLQANHAAETMLRCADGLLLQHGRLAAAEASGSARLHAMIARRSNPCADAAPHVPLRLDRPSGRRPYLVDILPLQGPPAWVGSMRSCCVVFISDLEQPPNQAASVLRQLFGLTAAEAGVALQIGVGEGLAGIAAKMEVGLSTVRTHLAHALDKTGLHRQAELGRLVERLAGPLREQESAPPPNG